MHSPQQGMCVQLVVMVVIDIVLLAVLDTQKLLSNDPGYEQSTSVFTILCFCISSGLQAHLPPVGGIQHFA